MSMEDIDEGISAFLCPITNAVFEEPVVADDGRTYSQLALLEWFASCRQQGLPITSPFTRAEISERVVPNFDMAKAIKEYQAERVAAATTAAADPCAPVARGPQQDAGAVTSLAELGSVFALLDGLRGLLAETLDGWQPPQIVVVGQESSGKSSVLERLMMVPILPRDEVCELLPDRVRDEVHLRHSGARTHAVTMKVCTEHLHAPSDPCSSPQRPARNAPQVIAGLASTCLSPHHGVRAPGNIMCPSRLEIYNTQRKVTERGPYVIAAQSGVTHSTCLHSLHPTCTCPAWSRLPNVEFVPAMPA